MVKSKKRNDWNEVRSYQRHFPGTSTRLFLCVCLYVETVPFLTVCCHVRHTHTFWTGNRYTPSTLRQTQVIVIPNNEPLNKSFQVFDQLIGSINQARRNARDYVTDLSLQNLDDKMDGDTEVDWR